MGAGLLHPEGAWAQHHAAAATYLQKMDFVTPCFLQAEVIDIPSAIDARTIMCAGSIGLLDGTVSRPLLRTATTSSAPSLLASMCVFCPRLKAIRIQHGLHNDGINSAWRADR